MPKKSRRQRAATRKGPVRPPPRPIVPAAGDPAATSAPSETSPTTAATAPAPGPRPSARPAATGGSRVGMPSTSRFVADYSYVGQEARRIGVLAILLFAAIAVLSLVL
ncbi:MAG: hypothetical protein HYX99_03575 [Chloroflexi bacterium]|nr:hypothetical protein [Chloroflexota bacterium]